MPQAPFAVGFATSRLTCPSPNSSITSEETVVVLLLGYGLRRSFSLSFSPSLVLLLFFFLLSFPSFSFPLCCFCYHPYWVD